MIENLKHKELIIFLGPKSLYLGGNTKNRIPKGKEHFRKVLGDKYPMFNTNFWQNRPNPRWTTQTRIAGLALSAPFLLNNIHQEEVYFPTIDALIEVIRNVYQVTFILYGTPFKSPEFAAYWHDTETLNLVLPRYLELKYGVTTASIETIFVSDINNASEVFQQLHKTLLFIGNRPSIFNVQDAPPILTYALMRRQQRFGIESECIWLQGYDNAELGRDIPIFPVTPAVIETDF